MSIQYTAILIGIAIAIVCAIDAQRWNRLGIATLHRFFLLDGRLRIEGFTLTISAANLSLGNFLIFIAIWGYTYGASGLAVFVINLLLNVIGFLLYLNIFRPYIEDRTNSGTIHEYISSSYSKTAVSTTGNLIRLIASIVTVTGLALAIIFELSLAVDLLAPASPIERVYIFAGLSGLIALFTAHGGFRTLFISDAINGALLTFGSLCLVVFIWFYSAQTGKLPFDGLPSIEGVRAIGWPPILSIIVIGSGWMLVAMDQWQRSCAARSYSTTWRGTIIYFAVVTIFATIFATWGAFDANVLPQVVGSQTLSGSVNPLMDIARIPDNGFWSHLGITFAVTGLVFAAVSTTNTFLNVASHSLTSDVIVGLIAKGNLHSLPQSVDRFFVTIARTVIITIVGCIVVLYALATSYGLLTDPLSFFFIAYSVQFALLAPMVFSALPRNRRPSAISAAISLAIGFITSVCVGFGAWYAIQIKIEKIIFLAPGDWLTLAPVVTLAAGTVPLLIGGLIRYGREAAGRQQRA